MLNRDDDAADLVFGKIRDDDIVEGLETPRDPRSVTGGSR